MSVGSELDHRVDGLISVVNYRTYRRWLRERQKGKLPRHVGRPRPRKMTEELQKLIARMAKENPVWGYLRIVGELMKLRCKVSKSTVRRILIEECRTPKPLSDRTQRPDYQPWDQFIKLHINTLVACDFLCKTIFTPFGKRQSFLLTFIHLGSRKVWASPCTYHPTESWVQQQAHNVMMWLDVQGLEASHLLHDRDCKFARSFDRLFASEGVSVVKTPFMAPNANAFAESFIATLKRECLNYFFCFSQRHLDYIVQTYVGYYNAYRPHQGLENRVPSQASRPSLKLAQKETSLHSSVACKSQLGGLLKHYYRVAA